MYKRLRLATRTQCTPSLWVIVLRVVAQILIERDAKSEPPVWAADYGICPYKAIR